jgi:hypothetical protein
MPNDSVNKRKTNDGAFSLTGLEVLISAAAARRLILFVGGGVSQSLGLPDFTALVQHISDELNLPSRAQSTAEYSVIAEAYQLKHGELGALRSWMDITWHPSHIRIEQSELHNLIVDLDFSIIYTTNYDHWLEAAFKARRRRFHKITSMGDLTNSPDGATEIIKFHGDFEDDESLVLTESSYFQRMIFESPLDIRLRSDSLARPLLFIGYSLHDINTRYLLFRLQELWKNSPNASQRPLSYILMAEEDPAQETVLRSRGVEPIQLEGGDPGAGTVAFLRALGDAVDTRTKKRRRVHRKA